MTQEEEIKLIRKAQEGDLSSKEKLILGHRGTVENMAKLYKNRGVDMDDLISEGNLGLMRAIDKFDITKNVRLYTYASWWIRHYLVRALYQQARNVRIQINKLAEKKLFLATEKELSYTLGRMPTNEEIASVLGTSPDEVDKTMALAQGDISLDVAYGEDGGESVVNDFISEEDETLEQAIENKITAGEIISKLGKLEWKEEAVLTYRLEI